ncbi:KAP family P-loop NTPase fold protein [Sphingomonas aerolata]|uniref:KAP family P-loop NTPase fold protein n=1 Tax=Sphingomonas aerolata TaxID=185951 RepID=UPI002FE0376B
MIDDPWAGDRLNRQSTGEHLVKVLLERYEARKALGAGSYILNIDASWGEGKTFFLECLRGDLRKRGHAVAYVNAWQDDHGDDPLVTVMSAIEKELAPFFKDEKAAKAKMEKGKKALSIVAQETTKQVGLHFLKLATGIAADKTLEKLREAGALGDDVKVDDKALDGGSEKVWEKALENLIPKRVAEHQRANKSSDEFRERTSEAISMLFDKGMLEPMFVFVDELDRCRPLYAIRLLEDLKHLFAIKGIVFVVATDSAQLAHSVKAIYGAEFEARKYLRRFFDRVFVFPEADRKGFVAHLLASHGIDERATFESTGGASPSFIITSWANGYSLSNRDVEQCFEIISTFVTSWNHDSKIEPIYLLLLVYLFYHLNITNLTNPPNDDVFAEKMNQWVIGLKYDVINEGEKRSMMSGRSMLMSAREQSMKRLIDVVSPFGTVWERVLYNERMLRFPNNGAMPNNLPTSSYMAEYPSRIRNAGRVIED